MSWQKIEEVGGHWPGGPLTTLEQKLTMLSGSLFFLASQDALEVIGVTY